MKTIKILFTIFCFILAASVIGYSKTNKTTGANTADLNNQIVQEIIDILKTPYLKFADKDLNGEVIIGVKINEDGKITFTKLSGGNENLSSNVIQKLNSLNLWTSPDYQKNSFSYLIKYRN